MSDGAAKSFVPNVVPKNDAREQARLQAQIGNMRQQNSQFIVNEVEKKYTLEKKGEVAESAPGEETKGPLDLTAVPAVYFSSCRKGDYVIEHRTSKILIESCEDCVIEINGKILTACVEIWKCKNVHLKFNTKVKTLQADIMAGLKVVFATPADMQSIVWQDVDNIDISFADNSHPQLLTGHAHMQTVYPDSDMKIDQFIIRFVPELGPGLQPERCVRLKNGFLSTEREAADWDRRNERARDLFVDKFLKEGGIHLNKDKNATKKIPPNSICACGSKKKYKNCCYNKKTITGLHETQKPKVYVQDKSGVKVETKQDETSAMAALAINDSPNTTSSAATSDQTKPAAEAEKPKSQTSSEKTSAKRTPSEKAPSQTAPSAASSTEQATKPAEKKSGKSRSTSAKSAEPATQAETVPQAESASQAVDAAPKDEQPQASKAVESKLPEAKQSQTSTQNEAVTIHTETSAAPEPSTKTAQKKKKAAKKN